jgi:molybdopterin converting factor small subunit
LKTITVKVEWIAPEGLQTGKPTDDFNLAAGSSIIDLIKLMVEIHGEKARQRILQDDGLTPYVNFIVGGKIVGFDYVLDTNTELMILPPIYGG